jgi:RNAse (barnase) inhibitor barstar
MVDLTTVSSREELHSALARALDFPDFYGSNWAAFWDAITGLVEMPHRLVLQGWLSFAARLPEEAGALQSCLEDAAAQFPESSAEVEFT